MLPLVEGVMVDYHSKKNIAPSTKGSITVKYGVPRVLYILSLFKVQPFAGIIDTVKYGVPRVLYILSLFKVQPFAGIIDTVKYGVPRVLYILSLFKVQPFA
jgi:hypothetical protein